MSQLERVPASRLRPGDVLYACEGHALVREAFVSERRVDLLFASIGRPNGANSWFWVPHSTFFKRVVRSRRIEMGRKTKRGKK